jgi:signal transduction histidine kinase
MLNGNSADLTQFLSADPRGQALPGYLRDLSNVMMENRKQLHDEIKSLVKQLDHVKAIVALQQDYARNSNLVENLNPIEVMEDAFVINRDAYERNQITVVRKYENPPKIFADHHKILQILINLLNNARHAVKDSAEKRVTLRIRTVGERVRFEVSDTGVGIAPENLERIFMHGFTTRASGHGFGLHSEANAAKEMNGQLFVSSQGLGQGATFILELPIVHAFTEATRVS